MQITKSTKALVLLAMLVAISIILGKYLAFNLGEVLRFSAENLPVIFAGIALGPVAGIITGTVADIIGCLMVGYTINPIVTAGAAIIGATSGIVPYLAKKNNVNSKFVIALTVAFAHLFGSIIIKTAGLAAYYNMPYGILLLWRIFNYVIIGGIECFVLYALLNSKGIKQQINKLREDIK